LFLQSQMFLILNR